MAYLGQRKFASFEKKSRGWGDFFEEDEELYGDLEGLLQDQKEEIQTGQNRGEPEKKSEHIFFNIPVPYPMNETDSNIHIIKHALKVSDEVALKIVMEISPAGEPKISWKDRSFVQFTESDVGTVRMFGLARSTVEKYVGEIPDEERDEKGKRVGAAKRKKWFYSQPYDNRKQLVKSADAKFKATTGKDKVNSDNEREVALWWDYIDDEIIKEQIDAKINEYDFHVHKFLEKQDLKGGDYFQIIRIANLMNQLSADEWKEIINNSKEKEISFDLPIRYNQKLNKEELDYFESKLSKYLVWLKDQKERERANAPKDGYETAISEGKVFFTANYGWIDGTHAFTDTQRNEPYIGVEKLWNQLKKHPSIDQIHMDYYSVNYKQDIVIGNFSIGVERQYLIRPGLSLDERKSVALAIFQNVSMAFEELQGLHPTSGSSFEPADLPSNMLNFYRIVEGINKEEIMEMLEPLSPEQSLEVYRSYPGTFTDSRYKNRSFDPRYFDTPYTSDSFGIPDRLNTIKPASISSFRDFGKANLILLEQDIFKVRSW